MRPPSQSDIDAAYEHAVWLRQIQSPLGSESRMLADLGYEVKRLRAALLRLSDAEWASCEKFDPIEIHNLEQALAEAETVLGRKRAIAP